MNDEQKKKLGNFYEFLKEKILNMPTHGANFEYNESPSHSEDFSYRNINLYNTDKSLTLKVEFMDNFVDIIIHRSIDRTDIFLPVFFDEEQIIEQTSIYNLSLNKDIFLLGDKDGYEMLINIIYSRLMFPY